MKKSLVIFVFIFFSIFAYAQFGISFSLPEIDVSNLKVGDDIVIPIVVSDRYPDGNMSGNLCVGHSLFFKFDHKLLAWKGTADNPQPGVQNFSPLCPFSMNDWLFNDNGVVQACIWIDPNFSGENFPKGTVLFEYVFTYLGGLKEGESSNLVWTKEAIIEDNKMKEGKSEAITDKLINYDEIGLINGRIFNKK